LFSGAVKVTAVDRAGNVTEQKLNLTTPAPGRPVAAAGGAQCPSGPCPAPTETQPPRALPPSLAGNSQNMVAVNDGPKLEPTQEPAATPHVEPTVQRVSAR